MPKKPLRPCQHQGCPKLTNELYCEEHRKLYTRESAAKRGYTSKWQKMSKQYLRKHPLCVKCMANGKYVPATVVDHIKPHRGDKELMWNQNNWQSLCKPCHDKKTLTEDIHPKYSY